MTNEKVYKILKDFAAMIDEEGHEIAQEALVEYMRRLGSIENLTPYAECLDVQVRS